MNGLFDYIPGNSALHRLDPLAKLAAAFVLCAACFAAKSAAFCALLIAAVLAASYIAGASKRIFALLRTLVKLGLFLFVVQALAISDGRALLALPSGRPIVTDEGIAFSLLMSLRLIAATLPLSLAISVTKQRDLSRALRDRLHIPAAYVFALASAIRFIPLLSSEMAAIIEAQTARGVEFDTGGPLKKLRLIFPLCVPMIVTAVRKTESAAISAELRGFGR